MYRQVLFRNKRNFCRKKLVAYSQLKDKKLLLLGFTTAHTLYRVQAIWVQIPELRMICPNLDFELKKTKEVLCAQDESVVTCLTRIARMYDRQNNCLVASCSPVAEDVEFGQDEGLELPHEQNLVGGLHGAAPLVADEPDGVAGVHPEGVDEVTGYEDPGAPQP